jgi:hypothetical protein
MIFNKNFIEWFNKNKNISEYKKIQNIIDPNYKKCIYCDDSIYYYDSTFSINRSGILYYKNKSYNTIKKVYDTTYNLCVCETWLIKKYPEYKNKNKSRVFNMMNDITAYAFNIPDEIKKKWMSQKYKRTLDNYISIFGEDVGKQKWIEYCNKQSKSNCFEYKKSKYNWDEEKFNEYNKSRAITKNNFINKHGEIEGIKMWDNYINKQSYSCTKEYFICNYGEINGIKKYNNFCEKRIFKNISYSNISQLLFKNVDSCLNNYSTYYATKNNEYCLKTDNIIYYLDYYIEKLNIAIEFNGDIWHGNPTIFNENDNPIPFNKELKCKDIWKKDEQRIKLIKNKFNIDVIIIWEKYLNENGLEKTIKYILSEIDKLYVDFVI